MNRNTVIQDARVLTADYLPNKMLHRGNERQVIADNLRPILEGFPPIDMLIYGPPGTGKSAMAQYVVEELKKHSPQVLSGTVDGFGQPSRFEVYYKLLRDMNEFVMRDGTSTEKLVDMFEEKARKQPMVVVLDEVDQIKDEKVLFDMSRYQKVAVILIANRRDIFASLDDRIRSSFSGIEEIRFKAYDEKELVDILEDRVKYGLRNNSVRSRELQKIASHASGDARIAINSLKLAAQKAETKGLKEIPGELIEESFSTAVEQNKSVSLQKLNDQQKALYKVLKERGEVRPGELYEVYESQVDSPRSKRSMRRYMKDMHDKGLVDIRGSTQDRIYSLQD